MNRFQFEAEIVRGEGVAVEVVRERVYGLVRVSAEWPAQLDAMELRLAVNVEGDVDRLDAPAYVELFFHDVFLLMNLAAPGSFSGTISISGGELRVRELAFSARLFEVAAGLQRLPLEQVSEWYDSLRIGTRQVAFDGVTAALFELLHLSRKDEDEQESIVRLASACAALERKQPRLFALRDAILQNRAPVFHPLHDDALDPRVEDATREWIEAVDEAASAILSELQGLASRAAAVQ